MYACDIPVFEYALKMWPPDAYELVVVHRGGQDAADLLKQLREAVGASVNMVVREAAPEEVREKYGVLLEASDTSALPWLIVRSPVRMDIRRLVWAGPASATNSGVWLDSPMRRKLAHMLRGGSVGVWVFLESGDRIKDEAAYSRLESELSRLERVISLSDEFVGRSNVAFQILRLSRDDPAEKVLLLMLTKSEPDLEDLHAEPMVFPVYGRGMVLYALVGAGINTFTITEAADFLIGECSCEIKSQNPGLEILMTADWEGDNSAYVGLAGFAERADQAEELLETVAAMATEEDVGEAVKREKDDGASSTKLSAAVLLFLSAGVIGLFVLGRRRKM